MLQRNGTFAIFDAPLPVGTATIRKRCLTYVVTALWSVEAPVKICSRVFRFGQSLRTSSDRLHNATKGGSHCNNNVQCDPRSNTRPKEKLDHNCVGRQG